MQIRMVACGIALLKVLLRPLAVQQLSSGLVHGRFVH